MEIKVTNGAGVLSIFLYSGLSIGAISFLSGAWNGDDGGEERRVWEDGVLVSTAPG